MSDGTEKTGAVDEQSMTAVTCPRCHTKFRLSWDGFKPDQPQTLHIRSCPSGGIYNVYIACPQCNHEEEL